MQSNVCQYFCTKTGSLKHNTVSIFPTPKSCSLISYINLKCMDCLICFQSCAVKIQSDTQHRKKRLFSAISVAENSLFSSLHPKSGCSVSV